MSIREIADKLSHAANDIRDDKDPVFKKSRSMFKTLPIWFLRIVMNTMSFLVNELNMSFPGQGMPRDMFGSCMISNVGSLGIEDFSFAPFVSIARCPIVITLPRACERPWVVDGRVEVRPTLKVGATFDHRILDGYLVSRLVAEVKRSLIEPSRLLTEGEQNIMDS